MFGQVDEGGSWIEGLLGSGRTGLLIVVVPREPPIRGR